MTAPAQDFRPAVGLRKIGFPLRRRLEKINFLGAGGPPPMIRCRTPQLAPTVNAPRIRRRLVARFSSKPCLEEIHSILSFCIGRMSISMAHGKPWMDSRTRSTAAHLVMNVSYATRPKTPSRNSWLHSSHKCGTSSDSCCKLHVCISRYLVSGSCRDVF